MIKLGRVLEEACSIATYSHWHKWLYISHIEISRKYPDVHHNIWHISR